MDNWPHIDLIGPFLLPLAVGILLGLFFFGGLWWTVRRLPTAQNPALLVLGSLALRVSVSLAGFYWIMNGQWERLLVCVAGFLIARMLLVRHYSPGQLTG